MDEIRCHAFDASLNEVIVWVFLSSGAKCGNREGCLESVIQGPFWKSREMSVTTFSVRDGKVAFTNNADVCHVVKKLCDIEKLLEHLMGRVVQTSWIVKWHAGGVGGESGQLVSQQGIDTGCFHQ